MVWTTEQTKQLNALGFSYQAPTDKWVRRGKDHDEFIRATAEFLYWFDTKDKDGGYIRGSNRWPIMDFGALVIFLRAIQYLEKEIG